MKFPVYARRRKVDFFFHSRLSNSTQKIGSHSYDRLQKKVAPEMPQISQKNMFFKRRDIKGLRAYREKNKFFPPKE